MTAEPSPPRANLVALGQALKRQRLRRGFTLDQLAVEAAVSRRTVAYAEAGTRAISIDRLIELAAALGVRLSDLLAAAELDGQDS